MQSDAIEIAKEVLATTDCHIPNKLAYPGARLCSLAQAVLKLSEENLELRALVTRAAQDSLDKLPAAAKLASDYVEQYSELLQLREAVREAHRFIKLAMADEELSDFKQNRLFDWLERYGHLVKD